MNQYRWDDTETAAGYDAAAELIHPFYGELQTLILDCLPFADDDEFLLVHAGGGSGRLVERFLERYPAAQAVLIDQSEPFLELAGRRLARFGSRAALCRCRLQDDWVDLLPDEPSAVVSMSAVHHLDRWEKRDFYSQCARPLTARGILLNADEVRHDSDERYLEQLRGWSEHMDRLIDGGSVSGAMADTLRGWQKRNIEQFDDPRRSGDDCHETTESQIDSLRAAGFFSTDVVWQKQMWALFRACR